VREIIQVCTATAQVWPIADRIHDAKTTGKGCVCVSDFVVRVLRTDIGLSEPVH